LRLTQLPFLIPGGPLYAIDDNDIQGDLARREP
jgi:hypothetical protein